MSSYAVVSLLLGLVGPDGNLPGGVPRYATGVLAVSSRIRAAESRRAFKTMVGGAGATDV